MSIICYRGGRECLSNSLLPRSFLDAAFIKAIAMLTCINGSVVFRCTVSTLYERLDLIQNICIFPIVTSPYNLMEVTIITHNDDHNATCITYITLQCIYKTESFQCVRHLTIFNRTGVGSMPEWCFFKGYMQVINETHSLLLCTIKFVDESFLFILGKKNDNIFFVF